MTLPDFFELIKHNPAIKVYRRLAKELRSEDERPLDYDAITGVARKLFSRVDYDTFWNADKLKGCCSSGISLDREGRIIIE